jgi:essential nuclear protein 1
LNRYTCGKLPKAFKVIPKLSNWEEVLVLTHPEKWSNQAFYQATKLFISALNPSMSQRFVNMVLLPKIRMALTPNSVRHTLQMKKMKLNHHLYEALIKSCYQPPAFYKGIVIPICEGGDCSLLEAQIICSAMKKATLPALHSSAALHLLCQIEFSPTTQLFIRTMLEKRYALPKRVIESLVESFYRFHDKDPKITNLPVVWHQSLLHFVQTYKREFNKEQKSKIYTISKRHTHHAITPLIRKELNTSASIYDRPQKDDEAMAE